MKSILTLLTIVALGFASCQEKPLKEYKLTFGNINQTVLATDDTSAYKKAAGIFIIVKENKIDTSKTFVLKDSKGNHIKMDLGIQMF